jgi:S1-C subfamily serine protease
MGVDEDDDIPPVARPDPAELEYDFDGVLASVVTVRAQIPGDAFTAGSLGTERRGNGVVIDHDGLVLTIGYVIAEAEQVWLTTAQGTAAPAHVVAHDHATGLGLVQALARLGAPPLPIGSSDLLDVGQPVVVAGGRGHRDALSARIVARRPFAGYWEYYLEHALFTAPAHPHWGGAACIGPDGSLVGVGSLLVQEVIRDGRNVIGNMMVPIDVLAPILSDLLRYGRVDRPPRPWLGLFASDTAEGVVVTGLARGGPADAGGLAEGDVVLAIDDHEIEDLGELWRRLWARGSPGATVRLTVLRDGRRQEVACRTARRCDFLKHPPLH